MTGYPSACRSWAAATPTAPSSPPRRPSRRRAHGARDGPHRESGVTAPRALVAALLAAGLIFVIWLVVVDAPIVRYTVRLYSDRTFLKEEILRWGWAAPLIFMAIQALQVII